MADFKTRESIAFIAEEFLDISWV